MIIVQQRLNETRWADVLDCCGQSYVLCVASYIHVEWRDKWIKLNVKSVRKA
jgi:hypothetical protein